MQTTKYAIFRVKRFDNGGPLGDGQYVNTEAKNALVAAQQLCNIPLTDKPRHALYLRAKVSRLDTPGEVFRFWEAS